MVAQTFLKRSVGTLVGVAIDRVTAEPPNTYHPVAWLGQGLEQLEARTYDDTRRAGVLHLAAALAGSVATTSLATRLLKLGPSNVDAAETALFVAASSGGQMLGGTALQIHALLDQDDLDSARQLLPHLVGRDATNLSAQEIARAVIESVAENTVDAATSVVTYGVLTGPTGVWAHRTINTLDAMVGHRSKRYENFGWASANVDDVANWVPARLSVLATAAASMSLSGFDESPTQVVSTAFKDGPKHPSPNAGLIEAAFAAALGVTLGGSNSYEGHVEHRGTLGTGRAPVADDIARSVALSNRVVAVVTLTSLAVALGLNGARLLVGRRTNRRRT